MNDTDIKKAESKRSAVYEELRILEQSQKILPRLVVRLKAHIPTDQLEDIVEDLKANLS